MNSTRGLEQFGQLNLVRVDDHLAIDLVESRDIADHEADPRGDRRSVGELLADGIHDPRIPPPLVEAAVRSHDEADEFGPLVEGPGDRDVVLIPTFADDE